jgi:hypothetical protein
MAVWYVAKASSGCCPQEYVVETQAQAERLCNYENSRCKEYGKPEDWSMGEVVPMNDENIDEIIHRYSL